MIAASTINGDGCCGQTCVKETVVSLVVDVVDGAMVVDERDDIDDAGVVGTKVVGVTLVGGRPFDALVVVDIDVAVDVVVVDGDDNGAVVVGYAK
jgi:hypothetical protein